MGKKKVTVGLLSHYFKDTNLGCSALSICNVVMLDKAAEELGIEVEYKILVNEKQPHVALDFTDAQYEYRVFPSTKQVLKHPLKLWNTKVFDGCDIVFNLCAGDGFTDIYGKWRTFSESYMVLTGHRKGVQMVLSPQTIGPFSDPVCRLLARKMMDCCSHIFTRDNLSYELCCKMGQTEKTSEVIDVALALPFNKMDLGQGSHVGLNVSGLLYNDDANRFGLTIDYKQLVHEMVAELEGRGHTVHLIAHVLIPGGKGEDDFAACQAVHQMYPNTVLAPKFDSPIDVKGYIAGLDVFIGARMHATIASISSGVPVVPIAYSRKVNGLYGNMNYPYYLDAKDSGMSTDKMLEQFKTYLDDMDAMRTCLVGSKVIYQKSLNKYQMALKEILSNVRG